MRDIERTIIKECLDKREQEEKHKNYLKIGLCMLLIPILAIAFFVLPSKIADTISYYQSKKYGKRRQEIDNGDK